MIELLELKFSRRWQTNKIQSDWSNLPRHSSSRQFRSPRQYLNFGMQTINTYRTAVSPTLDLLCHEDFNVGRSEAAVL